MIESDIFYLFVDPINRNDSGITSYTTNADRILRSNGVNTGVISRHPKEKISEFRLRLAESFEYFDQKYKKLILEAPETGSATREISQPDLCIHIRLHCSAYMAEFIQGRKVDRAIKRHEQSQVSRASFVSSPSQAATLASQHLFRFPSEVCNYPNPAVGDRFSFNGKAGQTESKVVLFVGRFHEIKGYQYILECAKKFPDIRFRCVIPPKSKTDSADSLPNVEVVNGDTWNKAVEYTLADLVVITSVFETASMVGIEALSYGTPVVSWAHLGICEYGGEPSVYPVKSWDLNSLSNKIAELLEPGNLPPVESNQVNLIDDMFWAGFSALIAGKNGNHMPGRLEDGASNAIDQLMKPPIWKKIQLNGVGKFFGRDRHSPKSLIQNKKAAKKADLFVRIKSRGQIDVADPPSKPEGLITAFLYPTDKKFEAGSIITSLESFDDFRYVARPLLQVGEFSPELTDSPIELVDRINRENKARLSGFDHIILLDPPPVLVQAVRSTGTRQRTIVVIEDAERPLPEALHTDALILVGQDRRSENSEHYRRVQVINDRSRLHLAIRRAIQEGSPKIRDLMLPMIGFTGDHRDELMDIDTRIHQGIIVVPDGFGAVGKTANALYEKVAGAMTELAVTESVYLRYRSLCDNLDCIESRTQFLKFCQYDGVIFHVRS